MKRRAEEIPPPPAGYVRSARQAARELAAEGRSIGEAEAMVSAYLDAVARATGLPVHRWGLDDVDLDAIRASAVRAVGEVAP